jgi:hypothetical protein
MALTGKDENCVDYIEFADSLSPVQSKSVSVSSTELDDCIINGLKEQAGFAATELLKTQAPMEIINGKIIPALNTVGKGFDKKGQYVSFYDLWDLAPFGFGDSESKRETNANKKDQSIIGNPVQLYDRMYLDDFYNIPEDYRGAYYLPEIEITPYNTKVGGINLNPYALGGPLLNQNNPIESFNGGRRLPVVRYNKGGYLSVL